MKPYLNEDAQALAVEILRQTDGKIFSCVSVKENGETRKFNARLYDDSFHRFNNNGQIVVREMVACRTDEREDWQNRGYRTIRSEEIREITFDGVTIQFE